MREILEVNLTDQQWIELMMHKKIEKWTVGDFLITPYSFVFFDDKTKNVYRACKGHLIYGIALYDHSLVSSINDTYAIKDLIPVRPFGKLLIIKKRA